MEWTPDLSPFARAGRVATAEAASPADRAPAADRTAAETRVLVLARTRQDTEATAQFLAATGVATVACPDVASMVAALADGAGAVVVAGEAVSADTNGGAEGGPLAAALAGQPVWSDLPVVVLWAGGREMAALGNVTVVERPVPAATLVSVVRSALRARERQYRARDQFAARERDREAVRAGEERFRAAFDQTAVGMVLTDLAGRVVRANEGFARLVGRPVADLVGRDSRAYTHPDDVGRNVAFVGRARAAGAPAGLEHEKRYVRPDGRVVYAQVNVTPVRDGEGLDEGGGGSAGGPANGLFAVVEDVTARREAEAALAEARRRSDAALMAGSVGTYYWDVVRDRVYGDANFVPLFGVDLDPDGSAPVGRFLDTMHPGDRPAVAEAIGRTLAHDAPFEREYRVRKGGGGWRWVVASGRVERDAAGRPVGWPGVVVDITDRKLAEQAVRRSEERYRGLFEAIDQGFCVIEVLLDPAGRPVDYLFLEINPAFEANTGLGAAVGRRMAELAPGHERHWAEFYGRVAATGEPARFQNEAAALGRWYDVFAYRVGDPDARQVAVLFKDVTAERRAAEARERLLEREQAARREAERASRLKDEFLATLSHELRTPLNAILGWSQILERGGGLSADAAEGLEVIQRNARAQAQIVEDLLDMSRIIGGKLRLEVGPVDLAGVVRAAADTGRPAAEAKGVRLVAEVDPLDGVAGVSGDANRLQQVLWNLIANALKFTPRGGQVRVVLRRADAHAEVSVADTGEGISPEFLPHVFERFRQQDASTTRRHGGLGLGLSIVKQLVELHGGTVRAASGGPGQGATFVVALPLAVPRHDGRGGDRGAVDVGEAGDVGPPRAAGDGGGLPAMADLCARLAGVRVLVVDDEPDTREVVRRVLDECGAVVAAVGSAAEAVARVSADRPDVLVSDIGMPGEDGYSLIKRVRALGPGRGGGVPAVALTAYARAEDRVRAVLAGFQMHVAKPVEPAELVAMVASLAGRAGG